MDSVAPKLVERWPTLAQQLRAALLRDDEAELAQQVDQVRIVEMCDCGDDFCQSFYTEPPPADAYPLARHRNVDFDDPGWDGFLILDVVDERIAYVEILHRPLLD